MPIWDNIPVDKVSRAWNNLNFWQKTHHKEGIEPPDLTRKRGYVDLAITSQEIEEVMKLPAHSHLLRDADE